MVKSGFFAGEVIILADGIEKHPRGSIALVVKTEALGDKVVKDRYGRDMHIPEGYQCKLADGTRVDPLDIEENF